MVISSSLVWDITCKNWFKFIVNIYHDFLEFSRFFHTWFNPFLWKDVAKKSAHFICWIKHLPYRYTMSANTLAILLVFGISKPLTFYIIFLLCQIEFFSFCLLNHASSLYINCYDEKRWYKVPGYAYKQIIFNFPRLRLVKNGREMGKYNIM